MSCPGGSDKLPRLVNARGESKFPLIPNPTMGFTFLRVSLGLLFVLAFLQEVAFASVLAIDYGSAWIKASLMKPGVPFDVRVPAILSAKSEAASTVSPSSHSFTVI